MWTAGALAGAGIPSTIYDVKPLGGVSSQLAAGLLKAIHPVGERVARLIADSNNIYKGWSRKLDKVGVESSLRDVDMFNYSGPFFQGREWVDVLTPSTMLELIATELRCSSLVDVVENTGSLAVQPSAHGFCVSAGTAQRQHSGVVLCNGVWAKQFGASFGVNLNMRSVRGELLMWRLDEKLYRAYQRDGLYCFVRIGTESNYELVCGGVFDHDSGMVPFSNADSYERLLDFARTFQPEATARPPDRAWTGMRPLANPDQTPLVGAASELLADCDIDNLWLNLGHHALGITCAPASGAEIAKLVREAL